MFAVGRASGHKNSIPEPPPPGKVIGDGTIWLGTNIAALNVSSMSETSG